MAQRMAEQAEQSLREARVQLDQVTAPLLPEKAEQMTRDLAALGPEAEEAGRVAVEQLQPALQSLQQVMRAGDSAAVEQAAQQSRKAIERTQSLLRSAQGQWIERDPVVAAKWFAEAAAQALAERPPDFRKARNAQEGASLALSRAWQEALREAAAERLALSPSFRTLLRLPASDGSGDDAGRVIGQLLPGVRQWGALPQRQPAAISAPVHEADAPGYQEPLRLYFESLGKAQEGAGKR
jgi:hypothetical protein